jgi:hypothetical protein
MLDPKLCGASRRTSKLCRSRLPSPKSTAKVPPFSMRGVPVIAANPRDVDCDGYESRFEPDYSPPDLATKARLKTTPVFG